MSRRSLAGVITAVLACSNPPSKPPHPPGGSAQVDAAAVVTPAPDGPSERECDALVTHAVMLKVTELRATKPPDQLPTDAEIATLTTELRADPGCRSLSREAYRCAMAAKTLAEVEGCYSTRSSSTSNSSVAPGGMAPGAPRSP